MTKDEALKLALETNNKAWKHLADSGDAGFWEAEEQPFYEISVKAITAIKEALAQPEQEPVAFEKTVCPFCTSEWVTAEQHDRNVDRVEQEPEYVTYAGNGTAGFSEGERPTGFFIQADKRQPEHDKTDVRCECCGYMTYHREHLGCIRAAKLKEPEQEPVGWLDSNDKLAEFMHKDLKAEHDKRDSSTPRAFQIPVYTTPPQRTWVGLTDEEVIIMSRYDLEYAALIGEVQRKLKEKNT